MCSVEGIYASPHTPPGLSFAMQGRPRPPPASLRRLRHARQRTRRPPDKVAMNGKKATMGSAGPLTSVSLTSRLLAHLRFHLNPFYFSQEPPPGRRLPHPHRGLPLRTRHQMDATTTTTSEHHSITSKYILMQTN